MDGMDARVKLAKVHRSHGLKARQCDKPHNKLFDQNLKRFLPEGPVYRHEEIENPPGEGDGRSAGFYGKLAFMEDHVLLPSVP